MTINTNKNRIKNNFWKFCETIEPVVNSREEAKFGDLRKFH